MDYPHPNQKTMVQGDGVARGQFLCGPYTCTVCLTLSHMASAVFIAIENECGTSVAGGLT